MPRAVNALSKRKLSKELVVDVDRDRLVAKDTEDSWEPRSMLAVIDALDALRWAYILLEYGHEFDVCALFDDFIHKARQRPQQLDAFRSYYESATWKLCRELRSGRTFAESVAAVREDLQLFQEVMSRPGPSSGKSSGANSVGSSETRGTSECPEPSWPHHRFLGTSSAAWSRPGGWHDDPSEVSSASSAPSGTVRPPPPPPPPPDTPDKVDHTSSVSASSLRSSVPASSLHSRPTVQSASSDGLPKSMIHLDFFSGVGSAMLALQGLGSPFAMCCLGRLMRRPLRSHGSPRGGLQKLREAACWLTARNPRPGPWNKFQAGRLICWSSRRRRLALTSAGFVLTAVPDGMARPATSSCSLPLSSARC